MFWVDVFNKAPVLCDWNDAVDASLKKTKIYFSAKLQVVFNFNRGVAPKDRIRIASGYSGFNDSIMVSFFRKDPV